MPCYEVAIEARKNDTAEKCIFSAWIRGENTPKAVEEALQKVAYEHPDFEMRRRAKTGSSVLAGNIGTSPAVENSS